MRDLPHLRLCSLRARGLFAELARIGSGSLPWGVVELARVVSASVREVQAALTELDARGVVIISVGCITIPDLGCHQKRDWASIKRAQRARDVHMSTTVDNVDSPHVDNDVDMSECPQLDNVDKEGVPLSPPLTLPPLHPSPRKRGISTSPAGFDIFWADYPRKTAKAVAIKAFARLSPDGEMLAKITAALAVQRTSEQWIRDGGQYIPHPATWLNQRRWEDEVASISSQNSTQNGGKTHGSFGRSFAAEREARNRANVAAAAELAARRLGAGGTGDAWPGGGGAGPGDDGAAVRRLPAAAGGGGGE